MSRLRGRVSCLVLLGALAAAGCGGGGGDTLPREPVTGTVTLNGVPVDHGNIQFRPVGGQGDGTIAGAEIKGGKYSIPREQGPVAGGYRVIISSTEETGAPSGGDMPGQVTSGAKELIPAKYNTSSNLDREIKKVGDNTLNFELKK